MRLVHKRRRSQGTGVVKARTDCRATTPAAARSEPWHMDRISCDTLSKIRDCSKWVYPHAHEVSLPTLQWVLLLVLLFGMGAVR